MIEKLQNQRLEIQQKQPDPKQRDFDNKLEEKKTIEV